MANSTTNLDLVSAAQAQKEVTMNALADAASPAMLFGRRASATAGLVWGYYGGAMLVAGVPTSIANGTVTLTASATNYVEATAAGVVSANTVGFTAGRIRLYTIVTDTATVTSYTDLRTTGSSGGGVISVNGETGSAITLDAADVGADATGTAAGLIAAHEAAGNPHPDYLTQAEADALYAPTGTYLDAPDIVPVTWAATISIDLSAHPNNSVFTCTLAGDTTVNITGGSDQQKAIIQLTQDGTGGRIVTLGADFGFGTDIASFTATTTAGKADYIGVIYNSAAAKYRVLAVSKGY